MTYEKPELFPLGDADVLIQGSSIKNRASDQNGTGFVTATEVDE
jgi:hypothetical protein